MSKQARYMKRWRQRMNAKLVRSGQLMSDTRFRSKRLSGDTTRTAIFPMPLINPPVKKKTIGPSWKADHPAMNAQRKWNEKIGWSEVVAAAKVLREARAAEVGV